MGNKQLNINLAEELVNKIEAAVAAGRAPHKKAFVQAAIENFLGLPISVPAPSSRTKGFVDPMDEVLDSGLTRREEEEALKPFIRNNNIWTIQDLYKMPRTPQDCPTPFPPGHPAAGLNFEDDAACAAFMRNMRKS